jgi:hypothetical protein
MDDVILLSTHGIVNCMHIGYSGWVIRGPHKDQGSGDSWLDLEKTQTMASIGGFSSRFRQLGRRGSRRGPDVRFRRMGAAVASLAGGGEGGCWQGRCERARVTK